MTDLQPSTALTACRREELVTWTGWGPVSISPALADMAKEIEASLDLLLMGHEVTTQERADEVTSAVAEVERWLADLEQLSKSMREPFYKRFKEIKAATDNLATKILIQAKKASELLGEFEAEKIRIRERMERQAQEEARQRAKEEGERIAKAEQDRQKQERAEAERIAMLQAQARYLQNGNDPAAAQKLQEQLAKERCAAEDAAARRIAESEADQARLAAVSIPAPVFYQPEKTEGTSSKAVLEYDVTDARAFAEFLWGRGFGAWVREISFDKRAVTEWLNSPAFPSNHPDHQIPGLDIRRVLALGVKAAPKSKRPITAKTTRVEL